MSLIQRPIKTLGNREYALEKAANPNEPIKSAEVDGDLDTIYNDHNGNITTANLAANAGIVGTQLSATANILGSQLAAAAGIVTSQIVNNAITRAKLAVQSTVGGASFGFTNIPTGLHINTVETGFGTIPLTLRGGIVLVAANFSGEYAIPSSVADVYFNLYHDGGLLSSQHSTIGSTAITILTSIPPYIYIDNTGLSGVHSFTLTAVTSSALAQINTLAGGVLWAMEFA